MDPLGPLRDAFSVFVRCSDQILCILVGFCVIFWELIGGRRMTGSAHQALDVVFRKLNLHGEGV